MGRGLGPIQRKCLATLRESHRHYLTTRTVIVGVFGMQARADQESQVRRALGSLCRRGRVVYLSRSRRHGAAAWALSERLEELLKEVGWAFGQRAAETVRRMVEQPQTRRLRGGQEERGNG